MAAGAYALLLAVRTAAAFGSGHLFTHCAWSVSITTPVRPPIRARQTCAGHTGLRSSSSWLGVVALTAAAVATALGLMTRFLLREWQPKRSRALRSYLRRHTYSRGLTFSRYR